MKFNYKLMLMIAKENYVNHTFTSINRELTPGTKYMCTLNINTIFKLQVKNSERNVSKKRILTKNIKIRKT